MLFRKGKCKPKGWKLMIPEELVGKVMNDFHLRNGHFGMKKFLELLSGVCVSKKMVKRVRMLIECVDYVKRPKYQIRNLRD